MPQIDVNFGDRDTKRWSTCILCMIEELQQVGEAKKILDKFSATVITIKGVHPSLGVRFPENYPVPQELI